MYISGARFYNTSSVYCMFTTPIQIYAFYFYFFKFILKYFIYLFLERGRDGDREGEEHQCVVASRAPQGTWPATQACALMGN